MLVEDFIYPNDRLPIRNILGHYCISTYAAILSDLHFSDNLRPCANQRPSSNSGGRGWILLKINANRHLLQELDVVANVSIRTDHNSVKMRDINTPPATLLSAARSRFPSMSASCTICTEHEPTSMQHAETPEEKERTKMRDGATERCSFSYLGKKYPELCLS